jgi:DNA-binding transcriptional regulator YiaG
VTQTQVEAVVQLAEARRYAATGKGRRIRLKARLTLSKIGEAAETSYVNVLRWENGDRLPTGAAGIRWGRVLRLLERSGFTADGEPDQ